jgi:hypothetical protein
MKSLFLIVVWLVISFSAVTAQRTVIHGISEDDFFGQISKGQYVNRFFGFSFRFPESYPTMSREQITLLSRAGADLMKGKNDLAGKRIDTAMLTQATLTAISEKLLNQPGNSFLEIAVQKQRPGSTARLALAASVLLATSGGKAVLEKNMEGNFGKRKLPGARLEVNLGNVKVSEEIYVIMLKGYSVAFAITYSTAEGRENMNSVLDTLRFTK